jgi:O-6-methylguanine DNA methyltransferase
VYTALAEPSGRPDRVRAVAAAVGRAPIPIVVPCHRVVAADGALTGYLGGLQRKRALLDEAHAPAGLALEPARTAFARAVSTTSWSYGDEPCGVGRDLDLAGEHRLVAGVDEQVVPGVRSRRVNLGLCAGQRPVRRRLEPCVYPTLEAGAQRPLVHDGHPLTVSLPGRAEPASRDFFSTKPRRAPS